MRPIYSISLTFSLFFAGYILATRLEAVKPILGQPQQLGTKLLSNKKLIGDRGKQIQEENTPIVAAAGDIACDPRSSSYNQGEGTGDRCRMKATSDLLLDRKITAVLPLGDNQYESGSLGGFQISYDPTWGRVKEITRPVVGNHEYSTEGAYGYFRYFGASVAGEWNKGYYSYNLGDWHLIALNSNCEYVGGCGEDSAQAQWLKADLEAHPNTCTLAYWHHPRFSSGPHGNHATYDAFWKILYEAGVEIVLNGHDHHYERFAPQSPAAEADRDRGIRQFVVGTGGKSLYSIEEIQPNSEVRNADTYGVLKLALRSKSYDWQFVPEKGKTFTDSGTGECH